MIPRSWCSNPNTATGYGRLSIRGQLEGRPLVVAFVAGLALATPPVEYLAAMVAILASGATAGEQLVAAHYVHRCGVYCRRGPAHHLSRNACEDASRRAAAEPLDKLSAARLSPLVVVGSIGVLLLVTGMGKV